MLCKNARFACKEYRQKCKCAQPTPLSTPPSTTSTSTTPDVSITTPTYQYKCDVCCNICYKNAEYIINGKELTCSECSSACYIVMQPVCPTTTTTTTVSPIWLDNYMCYICCDICKYGGGEVDTIRYTCETCTPFCEKINKKVCDDSYSTNYDSDYFTNSTDYDSNLFTHSTHYDTDYFNYTTIFDY